MNREDIIRMARDTDLLVVTPIPDDSVFVADLERFAALVAAAEREACAKVCEERMTYWHRGDPNIYEDEMCAAAIRARNNP